MFDGPPMRGLAISIVIITFVSVFSVQPASAGGIGYCQVDKCVGVIAATAGGCADMVGFSIAPNYKVCAAVAAAAGGGISLVTGYTMIAGDAWIVAGTQYDLDDCNASDYAWNLSFKTTAMCTAATVGYSSGCVSANAAASGYSALGGIVLPWTNERWGCTSDIIELREVGSSDGVGTPVPFSSLPPTTQEEIRAQIRDQLAEQFNPQVAYWPDTDMSGQLKAALWQALSDGIESADGTALVQAQ